MTYIKSYTFPYFPGLLRKAGLHIRLCKIATRLNALQELRKNPIYMPALTRAVRAAGVMASDWLLAEQRRAGLALAQRLSPPARALAAGVHVPDLPPREQLSPGGHAHRGVCRLPAQRRGGEGYG